MIYFQDGCLSLEEFLTAMHLVVLKRNNIDLPEDLPPVLRPVYLKTRIHRSNSKLNMLVLKPPVTNPNKDLYNGKKSGQNPGQNPELADQVNQKESLEEKEASERLISNHEDEVDHLDKSLDSNGKLQLGLAKPHPEQIFRVRGPRIE